MPLSHVTKLFAVEDCKIAKMTADTGGSPTYAAIVDVPGIKTFEISGTVEAKELRGDNSLLDAFSVTRGIQVAVSHAKVSLDVLPILLGGATADSGSTPNQKATYDLLGTSSLNYFKLEAKTPTNGGDDVGGDVHFVLHKLILAEYPSLGLTEEDYRIVSFTANATPLISNAKWMSIIQNETAGAIT